jgi:microcystin-dependent protein
LKTDTEQLSKGIEILPLSNVYPEMKNLIYNFSLTLAAFLWFNHPANAQSTTITPGNNQPNLTATTTNNGIIVPKITLTASLASASPVTSPAAGLLVYNNGSNQAEGFYYWTGTAWQYVAAAIPFTATAPISVATNNIRLNPGTAAGQLLTWNGNNWVNTNPKALQVLENRQPYATLNYCIAMQGVFPPRSGAEPFVAEIALFGFNFAPTGWALCNGQIISIAQNTALFSLLGTYYGGDGKSTFALPDLRGRIAIGMGQGPGLSDYSLGQPGGIETITLDNKY